MPEYEAHRDSAITWAAVAATVAGPPILLATYSLSWTAAAMLLAGFSGYVGGVLPDTDSYSSIPRRWLNRTIIAVIDVSLALVVIANWTLVTLPFSPKTAVVLLLALVMGGMSARVDEAVQTLLPTHRQELHDLHVWIVVGTVAGIVVALLTDSALGPVSSTLFGALVGAALVGGVFTHLILDDELPGEESEKPDRYRESK